MIRSLALWPAAALRRCRRSRDQRLPRIAIDEPVSGPPAAELQLRAAELPVPVLARISARLDADAALLETRLAQHASRKTPVWLAVAGALRHGRRRPLARRAAGAAVASRQRASRSSRSTSKPAIARLAAYAVRVAATDVRAARDTIQVAIGGPGAAAAYTAELAPYVDLLAVASDADVTAAAAQLQRVDPGARIAVSGMAAGDDATRGRRTRRARTPRHRRRRPRVVAVPRALAPALRALSPLAALLDERHQRARRRRRPGSTLRAGRPRRHRAALRHRLLFDERTFATYLVYWSQASTDLLQLSLTLPVEGAPGVHRLGRWASGWPVTDYHRAPRAA